MGQIITDLSKEYVLFDENNNEWLLSLNNSDGLRIETKRNFNPKQYQIKDYSFTVKNNNLSQKLTVNSQGRLNLTNI